MAPLETHWIQGWCNIGCVCLHSITSAIRIFTTTSAHFTIFYLPFVNLSNRKMSKFQFPTFSSMHYKGGNQEHRISYPEPQQSKSCAVIVLLFWRLVSYSGLSSVVFIQDVEGDLVGDAPQQTWWVQVPLEAEQSVDAPFRSRARWRGPAAEPCCANKYTRRDAMFETCEDAVAWRLLYRFVRPTEPFGLGCANSAGIWHQHWDTQTVAADTAAHS